MNTTTVNQEASKFLRYGDPTIIADTLEKVIEQRNKFWEPSLGAASTFRRRLAVIRLKYQGKITVYFRYNEQCQSIYAYLGQCLTQNKCIVKTIAGMLAFLALYRKDSRYLRVTQEIGHFTRLNSLILKKDF